MIVLKQWDPRLPQADPENENETTLKVQSNAPETLQHKWWTKISIFPLRRLAEITNKRDYTWSVVFGGNDFFAAVGPPRATRRPQNENETTLKVNPKSPIETIAPKTTETQQLA